MKGIFKILTFLLIQLISVNCIGQDSVIRIGPAYSSSYLKEKYLLIVDGVPIYKSKKILKLIDTTMIDSIIIHKVKIYNCNKRLLYNAFFEIRTKDTLNLGLKKILSQTNNWIFDHPLADLYINDKKTNWIKGYRRLGIESDLIEKIELIESTNENIKCGNEKVRIKLKKE